MAPHVSIRYPRCPSKGDCWHAADSDAINALAARLRPKPLSRSARALRERAAPALPIPVPVRRPHRARSWCCIRQAVHALGVRLLGYRRRGSWAGWRQKTLHWPRRIPPIAAQQLPRASYEMIW